MYRSSKLWSPNSIQVFPEPLIFIQLWALVSISSEMKYPDYLLHVLVWICTITEQRDTKWWWFFKVILFLSYAKVQIGALGLIWQPHNHQEFRTLLSCCYKHLLCKSIYTYLYVYLLCNNTRWLFQLPSCLSFCRWEERKRTKRTRVR